MASRARLLSVLGLSLLGCRMDNPAFDRDADELGEVGSGDSTEQGESVGESSDADTTSDGESSTDTTEGDCPSGTACGPCQVCDPLGNCVPDVGASCDGPVTNCGDFLFGMVEGVCHHLAATTLSGRCDEQGQCKPPPPTECPLEKGEIHYACDPTCVTSFQACAAYLHADSLAVEDYCALDGPGPDCKTTCSTSVLEHKICFQGECFNVGLEDCEAYACDVDGGFCYESCDNPSDCALGFACNDFDCVPP